MVSEKSSSFRTVILTGPTAVGKSGLGIQIAKKFGNIEIVNADSIIVYRGFNIGGAKPNEDEKEGIPHHLVDICNPSETFTAGDFVRATEKTIGEIHKRGKRALIVGGTGFYIKGLLYGFWEKAKSDPKLRAEIEKETEETLFRKLEKVDPESAYRIGPNDRYRLIRAWEVYQATGKTPSQLEAEMPKEANPFFPLWIIDREKEELDERLELRTRKMLESGLVDEFRKIHTEFPNSRALSAVGYAQVKNYLKGEIPKGRKVKEGEEGLFEEILLANRQLVKKQRTWFRSQKHAEHFLLDRDLNIVERKFEEIYGDLS